MFFSHADKYTPLLPKGQQWLKLHTNKIYAVMAGGFNVGAEPAALIVRRAHARLPIDPDEPYERSELAYQVVYNMEKTLRQYGVTSAGDTKENDDLELVNIQLTKNYEVLDFGAFLAPNVFRKSILFNELALTIAANSKRAEPFLRSDSRLKLPQVDWGTPRSGIQNPQYDNIWIRARELSAPFLKLGEVTSETGRSEFYSAREEIENYVGAILKNLRESWVARGVP
jgi:hypothetical protein